MGRATYQIPSSASRARKAAEAVILEALARIGNKLQAQILAPLTVKGV